MVHFFFFVLWLVVVRNSERGIDSFAWLVAGFVSKFVAQLMLILWRQTSSVAPKYNLLDQGPCLPEIM